MGKVMSTILNWFKRLRQKFHSPGFLSYGILKPCRRCVYSKSAEPVLIYSLHRGPRIIVFPNSKCYRRTGGCIGFKECGKCFEQIGNLDKSLLCNWIEF